jgi:hypothetical protein
VQGRRYRHPRSKREQGNPFKERGTGAPAERQACDAEADGVICCVAQEVEGVGLEGAGIGR